MAPVVLPIKAHVVGFHPELVCSRVVNDCSGPAIPRRIIVAQLVSEPPSAGGVGGPARSIVRPKKARSGVGNKAGVAVNDCASELPLRLQLQRERLRPRRRCRAWASAQQQSWKIFCSGRAGGRAATCFSSSGRVHRGNISVRACAVRRYGVSWTARPTGNDAIDGTGRSGGPSHIHLPTPLKVVSPY